MVSRSDRGAMLYSSIAALIGMSPRKAPPQNALDNEMICGAGHPNTNAEIEFPLRSQIEIDSWKDLLLLII